MNEQDLKALAEFCGWEWTSIGTEFAWKRPDGGLVEVFQPSTNANDCEVLIRALNADKWCEEVNVWWGGVGGCVVTVGDMKWEHDDEGAWKQGVCELALQVVSDNDDEETP